MRFAFRLVDVFTERPLAGNQLAVVLDAEGLSDQRMQAVAREFNFSETTFVTPSSAAGCDWRVRIFTPYEELPMAGHPTIGTGVVLEALGRARERTVFELGVGPTEVRVRPGWAEMDQRPPTFGPEHPDPAALAAAISVGPDDLAPGLPPQPVGTGLAHLIVPVRSLDVVRRLRPVTERWEAAMAGFEKLAVYAFAREGELAGSDAHCRMFAPPLGIPEDPATGSAAGPLACYLAVRAEPGDGTRRFRFEQGFEMGRPSLLEASVDVAGGQVSAVRVGGAARIVGEGWLDLPD
ncbi:MAG TPA: PhzF family phenazine biosynthesis protein [Candidatus Dormibacteraeota bacterium]|nr:PhzF family phenazine biosynthesis protein [Candidatus Dormibacteraeota bacterium]